MPLEKMQLGVPARQIELERRKEAALRKRLWKRRLEGGVYRRLWGRKLPDSYPLLDPADIKRVLILQRNQRIGDLVVAMAVTGGLRQMLPHAHIATLVPGYLAELAAVDRATDAVIPQSGTGKSVQSFWKDLRTLRSLRWDLVVVLGIQAPSMQLAARSGARWQIGCSYNHRGDNLNRALVPNHSCNRSGWEYVSEGVPYIVDFWADMCGRGGIPIAPTNWDQVQLRDIAARSVDLLGDAGGGCRIGLHPFSGNPIRNWALGRFAVLGRELTTTWGANLLITGGLHDSPGAEWLAKAIGGQCRSVAGKLSVVETWSLVRNLDLLISVDTGIIHMAASVGTPVISLFGPGDPVVWGPSGQLDHVIQDFPACQRCKGGRCVQARSYCMEAITVDRVLMEVDRILQEPGYYKEKVAQIAD